MSNATIKGHTLTNRELLVVRTLVWLGIFAILFAVWGLRNEWPIELWASVFLLPATLVFAWQDYQANQFGGAVLRELNHWEFMIACLLMATGVASGVLLLLAIGWVCLGVVWLRPDRDDFDWAEWFKLPFAFFLTVPVWLDLLGSRHDWIQHFVSDLEMGFGEAWANVRIHVSILVSVYILGSGLRGSFFWRSLVTIPVAMLVVPLLSYENAASGDWAMLSKVLTWCFVPGVVLILVLVLRLVGLGAPKTISTALTEFIRKSRYQSHSVYLVSIVVGMQQYSLIEGWIAGNERPEIMIGVIIWVVVLCVIRARSQVNAIDLRSKAILASSLYVLLLAEWTDTNALRHVAFGLVIVAAMSWRRVWSWLLYAAAILTWVAGLPATRIMFLEIFQATIQGAEYLSKMFFFFGLLCMAVFGIQKTGDKLKLREETVGVWQPAMRFSFILLILFLSFQTLASFWPADREFSVEARIEPKDMRFLESIQSSGFERIDWWESSDPDVLVNAYVGVPGNVPYRLNAAERILKNEGWRVLERNLVHHPLGQAVELTIEQPDKEARVLYWWVHRGNAFANYMRGRRILWSGWHLSQQDFRLIILVSGDLSNRDQLWVYARSQDWFYKGGLE